MSENGSAEDNRTGNSSENIEKGVPEIRFLTQEAVNDQIKGFIAPLTRQLEELTQLVLGMVTTSHRSHYPRADYSTISGTAHISPTICLNASRVAMTLNFFQKLNGFHFN